MGGPSGGAFADELGRIRAWLFEAAWPLWAQAGRDPVTGRFYEQLALDGSPDPAAPLRLRVQARQIYAFSQAALMGWDGPARDIVADGLRFLTAHGWRSEGGWLHVFAPDGAALDGRADTYDHAFVLFALAAAARALGPEAAFPWVERTLAFMDARLADPIHGGFLEGDPPASPRRQNPHMHLLEAFLALYHVTGDAAYLERAGAIVSLFRTRFFNAEKGFLSEHFAEDWAPLPGEAGRRVEPGHLYEWVWLLAEYAAARGEPVAVEARPLFDFAEAHGRNAQGFAVDAIRDDGAPLAPTRRLWPQTEALRAAIALRRTEGAAMDERIRAILGGVFDGYLSPAPPGAWIDQYGPGGAPLSTHVPASILYHLIGAFAPALNELSGA